MAALACLGNPNRLVITTCPLRIPSFPEVNSGITGPDTVLDRTGAAGLVGVGLRLLEDGGGGGVVDVFNGGGVVVGGGGGGGGGGCVKLETAAGGAGGGMAITAGDGVLGATVIGVVTGGDIGDIVAVAGGVGVGGGGATADGTVATVGTEWVRGGTAGEGGIGSDGATAAAATTTGIVGVTVVAECPGGTEVGGGGIDCGAANRIDDATVGTE